MKKRSKIVLIIVLIIMAAALRGFFVEILPHAVWLRILLGFITFALILYILSKGHSGKAKQAIVEKKPKTAERDYSIDHKNAHVITEDNSPPFESPLIEGNNERINDRITINTLEAQTSKREISDNVQDDSGGDQRGFKFIENAAMLFRGVLCYRIGIALTMVGFLLPLVSLGYSKGYKSTLGIIGSIPRMEVVVNEFTREDMKDLFPTWSQRDRDLAYDRALWQMHDMTPTELDQLGKHVGQFKGNLEVFNRWLEESNQKDIIDRLAAAITIPYRHIVAVGFMLVVLGIGCMLWSYKK